MRYRVILSRVWLLVAVWQGVSATDGRPRTHDVESVDDAQDGARFSEKRQPSLDAARQRFQDAVPPTLLQLYADQESRGARLPNSVVRSFYAQGRSSQSGSWQVTSEQLKGDFLTQQVACVYFNLSDIPPTESTRRAELNLHVEFDSNLSAGGNRSAATVVSVYRAMRPLAGNACRVDDAALRAGHLRLVGERAVTAPERPGSDGRWTTLVVSRTVTRWRRRPEKNFGFVVVWTNADRSSTSFEVGRRRAYLVTYGSDRASWPADLARAVPTRPPATTISTAAKDDRRRRRHAKRSRRSRSRRGRKHRRRRRNLCRRRSLYVDFGEIGWDDWIVAPPGYEAFYCAGDCPFYLPDFLNTTNHAIVQSLIHSVDARLAPRPCCVPTQLSPMSMLYVDNDENVVLKNYQEMVVEACGCR